MVERPSQHGSSPPGDVGTGDLSHSGKVNRTLRKALVEGTLRQDYLLFKSFAILCEVMIY